MAEKTRLKYKVNFNSIKVYSGTKLFNFNWCRDFWLLYWNQFLKRPVPLPIHPPTHAHFLTLVCSSKFQNFIIILYYKPGMASSIGRAFAHDPSNALNYRWSLFCACGNETCNLDSSKNSLSNVTNWTCMDISIGQKEYHSPNKLAHAIRVVEAYKCHMDLPRNSTTNSSNLGQHSTDPCTGRASIAM